MVAVSVVEGEQRKMSGEQQCINVYIATPAGDLLERNVFRNITVSRLADDFAESIGWPDNSRGKSTRFCVELVEPGNPEWTRKLNDDSKLGEVVKDGDTLRIFPESRAGGWIEILTAAASIGSVVQVALMVADMWSRRQKKQRSSRSSKQKSSPDWDHVEQIYAHMTDGSRVSFASWRDDPGRIQDFVQILSSPSASSRPLWVVFVLKYENAQIRVDVSEGAANKQQLEQLIKYLNL
ncbi:MAG TPA: hypothetical protein VGF67_26115 [Ktedonobacteraceae bacterium]|jgi:hypothetical protein